MRGAKQERKKLHEHEAFLFAFVLVFVVGGFIFWSPYTVALDITYEGEYLSSWDSVDVQLFSGQDTMFFFKLVNSGQDPVAIVEFDVQCEIEFSEDASEGEEDEEEVGSEETEEEIAECEYVNVVTDLAVILPGEELEVGVKVIGSENILDMRGIVNVVATDGIAPVKFEVEVSEEEVEVSEEGIPAAENPLFKMLLDALGIGEEPEVVEDVEEEILPILYVDDGDMGWTVSQGRVVFGEIAIGEQETITIEVENLGVGKIDVVSIDYPPGIIAVVDGNSAEEGERLSVSITCAPFEKGSVVDEGGSVKLSIYRVDSSTDSVLQVICDGVDDSEVEIDLTPPEITSVIPGEGQVSGKVKLNIDTYDESGIANIKVYWGLELIGTSVTEAPYEFEFDTIKIENGLYTIVVKVLDLAGNLAVESFDVWVQNIGVGVEDFESDEGAGMAFVVSDVVKFEIDPSLNVYLDEGGGYEEKKSGDEASGFETEKLVDLMVVSEDFETFGEVLFKLNGAKIVGGELISLGPSSLRMKDFKGGEFIDLVEVEGWIKRFRPERIVIPVKAFEEADFSNIDLLYVFNDGSSMEVTESIISVETTGRGFVFIELFADKIINAIEQSPEIISGD